MNVPENMTLQGTLESKGPAKSELSTPTSSLVFGWLGRISLLLGLVAAPWMLGSVQSWAQYWIALALLAGLGFWWFETALNRRKHQVLPYIFFLAAFGLLVGGIQLIPLPAGIENAIAGRQPELYQRYSVDGEVLATAIESGTIPEVTSRLSLDREGTWSQIHLLFIGLAGLLLGCRLFRNRRDMLVLYWVVSLNAAVLAFFGLVHRFSAEPGTIFWVIELTNGGDPFGPYVNRNNASGYLLMGLATSLGLISLLFSTTKNDGPVPLFSKEMPPWRRYYYQLLYFVSELTAPRVTCLITTLIICVGIVSTLSRGGVIALCVGGIGTLLVYGMARRPKHVGIVVLPMFGLVIALSSMVGLGDEMFGRFESTSIQIDEFVSSENRFQHWNDTMPAVREMGLFGSGLGTYGRIHRLYRTDKETRIFVYAENQYFQSLVEAGWPGLIVFILAWVLCWMYASFLIYRGMSGTTVSVGVLGVFLVLSQACASFVDFGLYIPANTLTFAVLIGFIAFHAHSLAGRLKKGNWLRFQMPNMVVQAVLLIVFGGTTLACLDLNRQSAVDRLTQVDVRRADYDSLDLPQTRQLIQELSPLLSSTVSAKGLTMLGDLWAHQCRLEMWEELKQVPAFNQLDGEEGPKIKRRLWNLTQLSRIHENLEAFKKESQQLAADVFGKPFLTFDLSLSRRYYSMSRYVAPLQADVQLQIGRINAIFDRDVAAAMDLERAVELAPSNPEIRIAAGMIYLQQDAVAEAAVHFRRSLELNPRNFKKVIELVTGKGGRNIRTVEPRVIFESFIPDDPGLLYNYVSRFLVDDKELADDVLTHADELLGEVAKSRQADLILSADINLRLGKVERAMQLLSDVLISTPSDNKTRLKLARIYRDNGLLDDAFEHAESLARRDRRNKVYKKLVAEIDGLIKKEREEAHN